MADSEEAVRLVLTDYHDLQSQLTEYIKRVSTTTDAKLSKAEVLHQLEAIHANIKGFGSYLSSTVPTTFYNERRLPNSTTAQKVLRIPELLELILQHANVFDILAFAQRCHAVKNIIEGSPQLQTQLFLRPAKQQACSLSDFQMHPLSRRYNSLRYLWLSTKFTNLFGDYQHSIHAGFLG